MRKRQRKYLVAIVLLTMALVLVKQALNVAVKVGLERGFAAGTGCLVSVEDATFNFFPLGASLKNGVIRHPNEPSDHGFRVRHGSVRLAKLYQLITEKRIRLTDLELDGVSARSYGGTTGFINTIEFLADNEPGPARPSRWYDFIARGWKVKLVNLTVHTDVSEQPQLEISSGPFTYKWWDILFTLTNTDPPKNPPS